MRKWKHFPLGLRTLKTAIAVTLAVLLVRLFATDSTTVFYAAFGALVAMDRTFSASLMQGLTQLVGVVAGTLFGYLSVLLFPTMTPAWIAGIGVLLLILLCNATKLSFTTTLSCIIFLSACLTQTDNILKDSLMRIRDTSIGIAIALIVNATIRPYNNKKHIMALLRKLQQEIPSYIECIVVAERYPDLQNSVEILRRVDLEFKLYKSQHFFHRRHDDAALLGGCRQLAGRMIEELEAINGMDSLGELGTENAELMLELGIELPEAAKGRRKCTRHDTIVMNYHLEKLLTAYRYLSELME